MYIDFHTHIIPGIDDGARDSDQAVTMLETAHQSGAETVILTPHISSTADIEEFVGVRSEKVNTLKEAMTNNPHNFPEILVGAEVALDGALSERGDISPLCIQGTDLILLELPYTPWTSWYNNEIYNIIAKHNVTPIMAHIERYLNSPKDIAKLSTLISFGVKFQINAPSFLTFSGRRIIRELAAEGLVSAIGSDCHNLTHRSPNITKALNTFEKKFGTDFLDYLYKKTSCLLENCKIK